MIVDAVMACLGYRTSREVIRTGQDRAILELLIDLDSKEEWLEGADDFKEMLDGGTQIAIQRNILPERSYLRINGRISTMGTAQSLGARLVDIHGQQEHHSLLQPENYLSILDSIRKDLTEPHKLTFKRLLQERRSLLAKLEELTKDLPSREREIDLLSYQLDEIKKAHLKVGEEEKLREEHRVISSQKELLELAQQAYQKMYAGIPGMPSVFEQVGESVFLLKKAASIDPSAEKVCDALEQVSYALEVALDLLRDYVKSLSFDPHRLKEVEDRLDLLERLKSKYGSSIEKIMEYEKEAQRRLEILFHTDEIVEQVKNKLGAVEKEMAVLGRKLSEIRQEIASDMEKNVSNTLGKLGMPNAKFLVKIEKEHDAQGIQMGNHKVRAFSSGFDKVNFLFSANPGEAPLPLQKVASGGELSRLMLAIKSYMEEVDPVPTLIFDEIDAGVGGKAGQAIAEKLWHLGRRHQVLCVTHLASIAAMADHHFVVSKTEKNGRTFAQVRNVKGDLRIKEIARMLSGSDLHISLEHAKELVLSADNYKQRFRNFLPR